MLEVLQGILGKLKYRTVRTAIELFQRLLLTMAAAAGLVLFSLVLHEHLRTKEVGLVVRRIRCALIVGVLCESQTETEISAIFRRSLT